MIQYSIYNNFSVIGFSLVSLINVMYNFSGYLMLKPFL